MGRVGVRLVAEGFEEPMASLLQFGVLPSPLCLHPAALTSITLLPSPYYPPHRVFTLPLPSLLPTNSQEALVHCKQRCGWKLCLHPSLNVAITHWGPAGFKLKYALLRCPQLVGGCVWPHRAPVGAV